MKIPMVFYREGSDPEQETSEWREIAVRSDRGQPPTYSLHQFSGGGSSESASRPSILLETTDFSQIAERWSDEVEKLQRQGFALYDPRTWRKA